MKNNYKYNNINNTFIIECNNFSFIILNMYDGIINDLLEYEWRLEATKNKDKKYLSCNGTHIKTKKHISLSKFISNLYGINPLNRNASFIVFDEKILDARPDNIKVFTNKFIYDKINNQYVFSCMNNNDIKFKFDNINNAFNEVIKYTWYYHQNQIQASIYNKESSKQYMVTFMQFISNIYGINDNHIIRFKNKNVNEIFDYSFNNLYVIQNKFIYDCIKNEFICIASNNDNVLFKFSNINNAFNKVIKYTWMVHSNQIQTMKPGDNKTTLLFLRIIADIYGINPENKNLSLINKYFVDNDGNLILDYTINNIKIIYNELIYQDEKICKYKFSNNDKCFTISTIKNEKLNRYIWRLNSDGYVSTALANNTNALQHRLICILDNINIADLDVHHIDGDTTNNSIDNLFICTRIVHANIHAKNLIVKSNYMEFYNKYNQSDLINPFLFIY